MPRRDGAQLRYVVVAASSSGVRAVGRCGSGRRPVRLGSWQVVGLARTQVVWGTTEYRRWIASARDLPPAMIEPGAGHGRIRDLDADLSVTPDEPTARTTKRRRRARAAQRGNGNAATAP